MSSGRDLIIVPDGLASTPEGRTLPEPSWVYRCVLDWLIENSRPDDVLHLAPANAFGGPLREEEAARDYLIRQLDNEIVVPDNDRSPSSYVDTRGNATILRDYLKELGRWPLNSAVLVSYHLHLPRALTVFSQEGFKPLESVSVKPKSFGDSPVVSRLWYYNYPFIHHCYELLAHQLFRLRLF